MWRHGTSLLILYCLLTADVLIPLTCGESRILKGVNYDYTVLVPCCVVYPLSGDLWDKVPSKRQSEAVVKMARSWRLFGGNSQPWVLPSVSSPKNTANERVKAECIRRSVDAGGFEVLLQNDRHRRVEHEVDVGRVGGVSEVTVDLFRLLIHAFEPIPNVLGRFRVVAATWRHECIARQSINQNLFSEE